MKRTIRGRGYTYVGWAAGEKEYQRFCGRTDAPDEAKRVAEAKREAYLERADMHIRLAGEMLEKAGYEFGRFK